MISYRTVLRWILIILHYKLYIVYMYRLIRLFTINLNRSSGPYPFIQDRFSHVNHLVTFLFFRLTVWPWVINLSLLFSRHHCLHKAHNIFFQSWEASLPHQRHQRLHYQIINQFIFYEWDKMKRKTKLNWSIFLWILPFLNVVYSQTQICQEWFTDYKLQSVIGNYIKI